MRGCYAFANRAATHFADHPDDTTFTDALIKPGVLFAVRWGLAKDVVVFRVFRVGEDEPVNYRHIVRRAVEERLPKRFARAREAAR